MQKLKKRVTIYHKSLQVLAYADDIETIGRTTRAVKETSLKLEKAAQEIGLTVNESKICMDIRSENYTLHIHL
jgi:hypothetical protein